MWEILGVWRNHSEGTEVASPAKIKIVRDTTWYSGSSILSMGLGLIRGFLAARWLGPEGYGMLSIVRLVLSYGLSANFGALAGLSREIPRFRGIGEPGKVQQTKDISLKFSLIVSGAVSVGFLI